MGLSMAAGPSGGQRPGQVLWPGLGWDERPPQGDVKGKGHGRLADPGQLPMLLPLGVVLNLSFELLNFEISFSPSYCIPVRTTQSSITYVYESGWFGPECSAFRRIEGDGTRRFQNSGVLSSVSMGRN